MSDVIDMSTSAWAVLVFSMIWCICMAIRSIARIRLTNPLYENKSEKFKKIYERADRAAHTTVNCIAVNSVALMINFFL